jgi:Domain of unknown function (DUF397)
VIAGLVSEFCISLYISKEKNKMAGLEKSNLPEIWRKPTESIPGSGSCVEVGLKDNYAYIRDSKNPQNGAMKYAQDKFANFTNGIKEGIFDL